MIGYSFDYTECETQAVGMSVRILRGENPATMPVYIIRNYAFALNLRMAREVGIAIPEPVLVQMTEIVQ